MELETSLISLFFGSLLAATILPGGSELMLLALLKAYPHALIIALLVATLGNTLGGLITLLMGRMIPQHKPFKYLQPLQRYGSPLLLLSWVPVIGDALCLSAGWLRLHLWQCLLFVFMGKALRYIAIAALM